MELRHDGPLPSYREELIPSQYVSLRTACVLAAALLVAFSLLDRELTPDRLPLLAVRLAGGLLLLLCGQAAGRGRGSPLLLCMVAVGLIAGTVEVALLKTGGAASPYLYSMMIVQAGISILIP